MRKIFEKQKRQSFHMLPGKNKSKKNRIANELRYVIKKDLFKNFYKIHAKCSLHAEINDS